MQMPDVPPCPMRGGGELRETPIGQLPATDRNEQVVLVGPAQSPPNHRSQPPFLPLASSRLDPPLLNQG